MPKTELTLLYQHFLLPKVQFLVFKAHHPIAFRPGQFFSLEFQSKNYRAYSGVTCGGSVPDYNLPGLTNLEVNPESESLLSFMISTKPGGLASKFFEQAQPGVALNAIGPNGKFKLNNLEKTNNFIATGTGLAPFLGMVDEILTQNNQAEVNVFFGCWTFSEDFTSPFLDKYNDKNKYPNFNKYIVAEDLQGQVETSYLFLGRVTDAVPKVVDDFINQDFYICGHPLMVAAMATKLQELGASDNNLYLEKFGK